MLGDAGKCFCRLLGDAYGGYPGVKFLGCSEKMLQFLERLGCVQIIECDSVFLVNAVVEVGMDDDRLHIGDNKQWRIVQRDGVALELSERLTQVSPL